MPSSPDPRNRCGAQTKRLLYAKTKKPTQRASGALHPRQSPQRTHLIEIASDRFLVQAISRPPYAGKVTRATVDGELKRFYYDTAQVANNVTLAAMSQLMPISQIVYGTDFPYRTAADDTKGVTEFFKGDDLKAVDRENVIRLIPRLKAI